MRYGFISTNSLNLNSQGQKKEHIYQQAEQSVLSFLFKETTACPGFSTLLFWHDAKYLSLAFIYIKEQTTHKTSPSIKHQSIKENARIKYC